MGGAAAPDGVCGLNVLRDDGPRRDDAVIGDVDSLENDRIGTHPDVVVDEDLGGVKGRILSKSVVMVDHHNIIAEGTSLPNPHTLDRGDGDVGVELAVRADLDGPAVGDKRQARARLGPLAEYDPAAVAQLKRRAFETLYDGALD